MSLNDSQDKNILKHLNVGMRIIKTIISVYLSIIITVFFEGQPTSAAIAALICTQGTNKNTQHIGKNRVWGTIIGAIYSVIFILIIKYFNIKILTFRYFIILCLLIIPIIKTTLWLNMPDATTNACIVLLLSLLSYVTEGDPYMQVLHRILDTMIGVSVAIIVNQLLPSKEISKKENEQIPEDEKI